MKTTNSSRPGTRTRFSPAKGKAYEVRSLRPIDGSAKKLFVVLAPEADSEFAATVRSRTGQFGETTYFAKIGASVYDWSPIQGGWICAL